MDPKRFSNLDQLASALGEDGAIVKRAGDRMTALNAIETRLPGSLAGDGADAFAKLTKLPGASDERLISVLTGLEDPADMQRLLNTANRLPESALAGADALSLDTVRAIAGREGSYKLLASEGYESFAGMLRESGGDLRLTERNFDALRVMRQQAPETEAASLADRVLAGDRAALEDLRTARNTLDVMKGRCTV
jgi:hypothetical protein